MMQEAPMIKAKDQNGTSRRQLLLCGVGSFCNDLICKVVFTFGLIFYTKVADLSNEQAGLVFVVGQVSNFFANFVFGYCCDHVDVPFLSRFHGRRKSWHLIGTVFTVSFFVLSFTRCLLCPEPPLTHSWLGFGYFSAVYGSLSFWWGAADVAHLTIIPETAQTEDEIVILNSIRAMFSYLGGVCSYGVAWIFLGRSNNANLSPDNSTDFMNITATGSAIGLLFVVMFHVGAPEMRAIAKPRRKSSTLYAAGIYSASVVYDLGRGEEKVSKDDAVETKRSSVIRVLRKVSTYVVPFDAEISQAGNIPTLKHEDELQEIEIRNDTRTQESINQNGSRLAVKSMKQMLKDPRLYKVTTIYASAFSLENLTFSYLALYLMDHLHFEKEATAYFSIAFLVSGIFGSALSKIVDKAIGRKWTFCGVATLAIGTATWFYFVTEPTKQMVYAPIVLFGCCLSSMSVMALSDVGDFVGKNKESSGLVFSLANATQKVITGGMLMLIQSFYPSSSDGCLGCGNYVRVVYPLALGFLPLIGLSVVLIAASFTLSCCDKQGGEPSESNVVANPLTEDTGVPFPSGKTDITEWNTRL